MDDVERTSLLGQTLKTSRQSFFIGGFKQHHGGFPIGYQYTFKSISVESLPDRTSAMTNNDNLYSNQNENKDEQVDFKSASRRQKFVAFTCLFTHFLTGCAFLSLGPFFPEIADQKGMSTIRIGLVFSVFEFVVFLTSPFFGFYLTSNGPNFFLLSGTFVGGVSTVLFGLLYFCPSGRPFFVLSLLCRAVGALGLSALFSANIAVLYNELPHKKIRCFALLQASYCVGMMTGPVIGGTLYELGGFGLPFFVIGGLILLQGSFIYFFRSPETSPDSHENIGSQLRLLCCPMILVSLLSIHTIYLGIAFLGPTLADQLEPFGLTIWQIILFFLLSPGLSILFFPFYAYILNKKNAHSYSIVFGHFLFAIAFLLLGPCELLSFLPDTLSPMIVGQALRGISLGCFTVPPMKCMITEALERGFDEDLELYTFVTGIFTSVFSLGGFLGALMGGVLVEEIGFSWASTTIAFTNMFMCIVTMIFFCSRFYKRRKMFLYDT